MSLDPRLTWEGRPAPPLLELNTEQRQILDACLRAASEGTPLVKVDGLAGTGKSQILAHLGWGLPSREEVYLCAPTGKAADSLASKSGLPVTTIHRAAQTFVRVGTNRRGKQQPEFVPTRNFRPRFLIVDEASMLERVLGNQLVARCSGTMFAFGDTGQLGPVEGEPWFADPDHRLTRIMRQGPGSMILTQARRVRELAYTPAWMTISVGLSKRRRKCLPPQTW